jgi:helicase MOV-10
VFFIEALKGYKIVISTNMCSSTLWEEGLPRDQLTHIFLDDAGQSSEPETMVPLSHLCRQDTVVVVAGDPMQFGPIVFCDEVEKDGLGKSYLQWLLCDIDAYHSGDPNYVKKLVKSYRCHLELTS